MDLHNRLLATPHIPPRRLTEAAPSVQGSAIDSREAKSIVIYCMIGLNVAALIGSLRGKV